MKKRFLLLLAPGLSMLCCTPKTEAPTLPEENQIHVSTQNWEWASACMLSSGSGFYSTLHVTGKNGDVLVLTLPELRTGRFTPSDPPGTEIHYFRTAGAATEFYSTSNDAGKEETEIEILDVDAQAGTIDLTFKGRVFKKDGVNLFVESGQMNKVPLQIKQIFDEQIIFSALQNQLPYVLDEQRTSVAWGTAHIELIAKDFSVLYMDIPWGTAPGTYDLSQRNWFVFSESYEGGQTWLPTTGKVTIEAFDFCSGQVRCTFEATFAHPDNPAQTATFTNGSLEFSF